MDKFKVGDRVRAKTFVGHVEECNAIGTIVYDADKTSPLVEFDKNIEGHDGFNGKAKNGHGWYVNKRELELINEPKPTYKVGDRVKATAKCTWGKVKEGDLGTIIIYNNDSSIGVEFDNEVDGHGCGKGKHGHCWWLNIDDIKLVNPSPVPVEPKEVTETTVTTEPDYTNSCWFCRKGGLVDLYLNGRPGICPKCGRVMGVRPY